MLNYAKGIKRETRCLVCGEVIENSYSDYAICLECRKAISYARQLLDQHEKDQYWNFKY